MNPADPSILQTVNMLVQAGLLGLIWFVFLAGAYGVLFKWLPYKMGNDWPQNQALKKLRVEAEIALKVDEVKETRLLREALQEVGASVKQIALLVDQHDRRAATGINDILALVRILLDKSGVDQATVESLLTKDDHRSFEKLLRDVMAVSKMPVAQSPTELARS